MKKNIIWIIGEQRSGKTTFSNSFKEAGAQVLNIGEEIRKRVDVEKFKEEENPYAPSSVEESVQTLINDVIIDFRFGDKETLVIDSAPRSEDQFDIIIRNNDFNHTLIVVTENYEVRKRRAMEKYTNLDYFFKREETEKSVIKNFCKLCQVRNINIITLNKG